MRKEMLLIGSTLLLFVAGCSAQGAAGVPAIAPVPPGAHGAPASASSPAIGAPTPVAVPAPAPIPNATTGTKAPNQAPTQAPNQAAVATPPSGSGVAVVAGISVATAEPGTVAPGKPAPVPAQPPVLVNPTQVTMADNGATVRLSVGSRLLVNLGTPPDWEVTVANQTIISRVPNVMVIRGAQGLYAAHAAGTTTLSAVGTYPCQFSTPRCMIASPLFRITVEVNN